jgi:hypothetical protein
MGLLSALTQHPVAGVNLVGFGDDGEGVGGPHEVGLLSPLGALGPADHGALVAQRMVHNGRDRREYVAVLCGRVRDVRVDRGDGRLSQATEGAAF